MHEIKLTIDGKEEIFKNENKTECIIKIHRRLNELKKQEQTEEHIEFPAKHITGDLLYSPFEKNYFFRVYVAEGEYKDYALAAEEIKIQLTDEYISLYEGKTKNKIDWSSRVLGK